MKIIQEIKVTQVVTFPKARRVAEGLLGQPTNENVRKISLQKSQPSNNQNQLVPSAPASTRRTQEGPRPTAYGSPGPSRSSPTGPRSTPRTSPRRRIQLETEDGTDVIRRPIHHDPFPEYSLRVRHLKDKLKAQTQREL